MFIVSVKPTKKKIIILSAVVAAVVLIVMSITVCSTGSANAEGEHGSYNLMAEGNAGRIEFLEQFGWKTAAKASKTEEITIPSEFNETYTSYNELQKQQGLDLTRYAGKECTKYTYEILNYDGGSKIAANLLVIDNRVIGGDISETKKDGFMHTFYMIDNKELPSASQNSSKDT